MCRRLRYAAGVLRLALIVVALCACKDKEAGVPVETPPPAIPPPAKVAEDSCTSGPSCLHAAHELEEAKDFRRAANRLRRGCELYRSGEACYQRALMLTGDRGIDPDPQDAHHNYLLACEHGFADGCADAGVNFLKGYGTTADPTKAYELLVKACTAKSGLGCYNLAVVVRDGKAGTDADRPLAVTIFQKACDYDYAGGCNDLGLAYHNGNGAPKDLARAFEIFTKACSLAAKTCRNLANAYERGHGVAVDLPRARQLYDKACGAGHAAACNVLGIFKDEGVGGPKDPAGSRAAFKQACDGGDEDGCKNSRPPE
jgi:TPR repeat protein